MNAFQRSLHSNTAKVLAAVFVVGAIGGPTAIKSADPKTRSHFTAKSARPLPAGDSLEDTEQAGNAIDRERTLESIEKEVFERLEEDAKKDRELRKEAAREESEQRRLEKQQRRLQDKLQAQIRDEKRRREKELARQLAKEEAEAKAAMVQRLQEKESEAELALLAQMEEEKRAREAELEESLEEKTQLAQAALADRVAEEEVRGIRTIDQELEEREAALREELEIRVAKEERQLEEELQKRISSEEKAAKKELDKRLAEREKLAEAELLARLELEGAAKLEELEKGVPELEKVERVKVKERLSVAESNGLKEIEESLLDRARREIGELDDNGEAVVARARESKSPNPLETKVPFRNSIKYVPYSSKDYEDSGKRPAILRTLKRAPRNLVASLGNLNLRRSDPYPGYLAYATPPPLRFSDSDALAKRASSPALPEFSFVAPGSGTEIIESELSEETARRNQIRNQIVVELDPYKIVSGRIDTTIPRQNEERDLIMGDQFEEPIVRPEEVLIFFENEREGGDVRTIVPFSPALPQENEPSRSGATYNRVE